MTEAAIIGIVSLRIRTLSLTVSVKYLSNIIKIVSGGWIVVALAFSIFFLMKTWADGNAIFRKKLQKFRMTTDDFSKLVEAAPPVRVKGTAIFLTADPNGLPKALLHNLKHNRVLHELTIILSVQTVDEPHVQDENRITVERSPGGIYKAILNYGFSETPDIPAALDGLEIRGFENDPMKITCFVGRESIAIGPRKPKEMRPWRKRLYLFLFKNAESPTDFFRLPAERVVELGSKTEL
jgi:KUP system potassium uptake protein